MEDEAKETFLATLHRPFRTTLNMQNFTGQTADTVIERALQLESKEEEEGLSMASLRQALPKDEEYCFYRAIQCTICFNSGHSTLDCNMRIHGPICHSWAHTMDQCEYNMLNRPTPSVSLVDLPPHDQGRQEERYRNTE